MSGKTAAERVTAFLDAREANGEAARGTISVAHGDGSRTGERPGMYRRPLTDADLRELLAENERLRVEAAAVEGLDHCCRCGGQIRLAFCAKCVDQIAAVAAAQHPADGAERDGGDAVTRGTVEKRPGSDAAGLALQFDPAGRDEAPEAVSVAVKAWAPEQVPIALVDAALNAYRTGAMPPTNAPIWYQMRQAVAAVLTQLGLWEEWAVKFRNPDGTEEGRKRPNEFYARKTHAWALDFDPAAKLRHRHVTDWGDR